MRATTIFTDGDFKYEFSLEGNQIFIYVLGKAYEDYGYWFPVADKLIDWTRFPENAALISDNVKEAVANWIWTAS